MDVKFLLFMYLILLIVVFVINIIIINIITVALFLFISSEVKIQSNLILHFYDAKSSE